MAHNGPSINNINNQIGSLSHRINQNDAFAGSNLQRQQQKQHAKRNNQINKIPSKNNSSFKP